MKKTFLIIFLIFFTANIFAQGQIQSFTVDPPAPATSDFIKIYVGLQFSSGGCPLSNKGSSTAGSVSTGYSLHCLGMLSVMCNSIDTFDLGYLPVGPHVFKYTLSSGLGGPPCSPGFIPDDYDSVNFAVILPSGITEQNNFVNVTIFPNPIKTTAIININSNLKLNHAELKITDIMGRSVKTINDIQANEILFDRDKLSNGIYFYQLIQGENILSNGKLVID